MSSTNRVSAPCIKRQSFMMTPSDFISEYRECFGESAPLPLAVVYTDMPLSEPRSISGCMFKQFHRAYNGETVTFDAESLTCGGGKLYTGLGPAQERVYNFVSNIERYKQSPELVRGYIAALNPRLSGKPYLNIVPIGRLDSFDEIEGLVFFVTPDVLSGLFAWANYDGNDPNAVLSPWGSGCASTITSIVNENRKSGKHCFIGMMDVSARPYFRPDTLSFSIPRSRFIEMCDTMQECCIAGSPAWLKVRKRINNNPINRQ